MSDKNRPVLRSKTAKAKVSRPLSTASIENVQRKLTIKICIY